MACVWPYAKGRTQCCVLDCFTCYSSQCDTKVEEDGQQTETTMVPATFTKHLRDHRRQYDEEEEAWRTNRAPKESMLYLKEMERLQLYFSAVSFWDSPLKILACRSANMIVKSQSVFIRTWPNPCPGMCNVQVFLHFTNELIFFAHFWKRPFFKDIAHLRSRLPRR